MKTTGIALVVGAFLPAFLACGSGDDTLSPVPGGADASARDVTTIDAPSQSGADAPNDSIGPDRVDATIGGKGDSAQDGGDDDAPDAIVLQMVQPTVALLRLANWSPDSPPIDACIASHGTGSFSGPVFGVIDAGDGAISSGPAFPFVSAYLDVAPGQYDVRIVVAGATSCAVGIGEDATALPAAVAGAAETIALIGEASPTGGDPPLQIVGFEDDVASTSAVALRFVNAAPLLPEADVGTGTVVGANFVALFSGIPFGQPSGAQEAPATDASLPSVDGNGYRALKALSNVTLSAHAPGATTDAVSTSGLSAASGSVLTIAIVGDTSSGVTLLECVDNAGTFGALANCSLLP